jgi:hypothetical protein
MERGAMEYKFGQLLKPTSKALELGILKEKQRAVFISKIGPLCIRIVKKGLKTVEDYHVDFWMRAKQ